MQSRKYNFKLDDKDFRERLSVDLFSSILELEKSVEVSEFNFKNLKTGKTTPYKIPFLRLIDKNKIQHIQLLVLPETEIEKLKSLDLSNTEFKFLDKNSLAKLQACNYEITHKEFTHCFFYNRILLLERLKQNRYLKNFIKSYDCKVLFEYDFEKVLGLFDNWNKNLKEEGRRGKANREDFIWFFKKENIEKYDIKILYFEIDNKLVGIRIVFPFAPHSNLLVLRHKIGIHDHRGFDIFMNYKTTETFDNYTEFTDGGDFLAPEFSGRIKYKLEKWKPDRITPLYIVKVLGMK